MRVDLENRCQSLSEDLEFRKSMFEEVRVCVCVCDKFSSQINLTKVTIHAKLERTAVY